VFTLLSFTMGTPYYHNRQDLIDNCIGLWTIQDALVQSYRSIFITSISLVLGFSTVLANIEYAWTAIPFIGLGAYFLWIWHTVSSHREKDVTFLQWLLLKLERDSPLGNDMVEHELVRYGVVSCFKYFQDNKKTLALGDTYSQMCKSLTRRKMSRDIPLLFVALHIFITAFVIFQLVNKYT
jgi:hypothetical protein